MELQTFRIPHSKTLYAFDLAFVVGCNQQRLDFGDRLGTPVGIRTVWILNLLTPDLARRVVVHPLFLWLAVKFGVLVAAAIGCPLVL